MPVLASAKTMPATPGMQTTGWTISSNVGVAISPFTRQQQTQEWGGEMWKVKVTLPPMLRAKAAAWLGFFASLHGIAGAFMLGPTAMARPQGVGTGAIANSLHSVGVQGPFAFGDTNTNGAFSIRTAGWTPNVNGILLAGDFIQLGNRLHMIVSPENSDAGGAASFDIWPSIRETVADASPIITVNPQGMFRVDNNDLNFDIDDALTFSFAFNAMEAL
jgi:hypothetical protein